MEKIELQRKKNPTLVFFVYWKQMLLTFIYFQVFVVKCDLNSHIFDMGIEVFDIFDMGIWNSHPFLCLKPVLRNWCVAEPFQACCRVFVIFLAN